MSQPMGPAGSLIAKHLPKLAALLPKGPSGPAGSAALCTHPAVWKEDWSGARGGRLFALDASVPDGFFACGPASGESGVAWVLWRRDDRRFAFFDSTDTDPPAGGSGVGERFRQALSLWEAFEDPVLVYSGPFGHYQHSLDEYGDEPAWKKPEARPGQGRGGAHAAPGEEMRRVETRWAGCDIAGATLPEPGHPLDSDDFSWAAVRIPGRRLLLAVVCDGVGSSVRKREASHIAVREMAWWAAQPTRAEEGLAEMLGDAARQAHAAVLAELQGTGVTTMVAALVDRDARRLAWASIGDSGVYVHSREGSRKLNHEHKAARPRMLNGRPVLVAGVPWMDHGLTQTVGQTDGIDPELGELEFAEGTILALASDGIKDTDVPDFLRQQGRVAGAAEVLALCEVQRRTDKKDDSTLVLVRLGEAEEIRDLRIRLKAYGQLPPEERDLLLDTLQTAEPLSPDLLAATLASEPDDGRALRILERLEASPVPLRAEWWVVLLSSVTSAGRVRIADRLAKAVGRAKTSSVGRR